MLKEGDESMYIVTSLKNLLRLFEEDALLEELDLGAAWNPFSGYVDAGMIFKPNPAVKDVLQHDYDFRGLTVFSTRIGSLKIEKVSDTSIRTKYEFRIAGPFKTLLKLEHLLIKKNAYEPGIYKF